MAEKNHRPNQNSANRPSRLLDRIEFICNRSEISNEVVMRVSGQNDGQLFWLVRQCQLILETEIPFLIFRLIASVGGFSGDATASGRLSWLERSGRCFEPIRKVRGLSQNQVFV